MSFWLTQRRLRASSTFWIANSACFWPLRTSKFPPCPLHRQRVGVGLLSRCQAPLWDTVVALNGQDMFSDPNGLVDRYPGRYTRWDIGFANPPLELWSRQRSFTVRALNPRGEVLLRAVHTAVEGIEALESLSLSDDGQSVGCRCPVHRPQRRSARLCRRHFAHRGTGLCLVPPLLVLRDHQVTGSTLSRGGEKSPALHLLCD